jgi:hypothetical protein
VRTCDHDGRRRSSGPGSAAFPPAIKEKLSAPHGEPSFEGNKPRVKAPIAAKQTDHVAPEGVKSYEKFRTSSDGGGASPTKSSKSQEGTYKEAASHLAQPGLGRFVGSCLVLSAHGEVNFSMEWWRSAWNEFLTPLGGGTAAALPRKWPGRKRGCVCDCVFASWPTTAHGSRFLLRRS